ncbi:vacuolar protein sorting-associated protein 45 [Tyrophagus putrescentiae]|nr:vacuolar protein sorting-associated protein 45 [Tyrophagus putrescentiae]
MDVVQAIKFYINEMIKEAGAGIKALLMDKETISIVSIVYAQSEMQEKEVFLFELLENFTPKTESAKFVKCIAFIRPTEKNLNYLMRELKHPRFSQYFLYFNNIISKTDIKAIADVDENELIKDVQEAYADYLALNSHTFSMNVKYCYQNGTYWNPNSFVRISQGLISLLLSLSRSPLIRYQANSVLAERLAEDVRRTIAKESGLFDPLFKGLNDSQPILLVLDRKFDPITPLLNQWTYQAMLHEQLTIVNNRVNLSLIPGTDKNLREVVLSKDQDEFYEKTFSKRLKVKRKIETIADMKSFIETYPQFKKMSGTVTKHVTLIDELSRLVNTYNLLEVSETEQEMISHSDHSETLKRINSLLANDKVRNEDALRLVLLYALTFSNHSSNDVRGLCRILERSRGFTPNEVKAFTKKMIKGFKGVENIYTQHTPELKEIIEDLYRGKLRETSYPFLGSVLQRERPSELIVFIIGGLTYVESMVVYQLNKSLPGMKIIAGGSFIHNSASFLDEVRRGFEFQSEIKMDKNVL